MKSVRIGLGAILCSIGVIFFILPGSILFLIGGLFLLSFDVPIARKWLRVSQRSMSKGASALDNFFAKRKRFKS